MVSRVLGIDLGTRRIGLAVADEGIGIARPLATVNRGVTLEADADAIGRVCA
jgi:RNase H-fold protein (predicted Holliday junction resolvase)